MRQVLSGSGVDTTSTVAAYLAAGNKFLLANLYLIGDYDDPQAIRLTDWQSPLDYPIWGSFLPAVVSRGTIESKIGLEVSDLEVDWTPVNSAPTQSLATANPYQLAQAGFYDNKIVRVWTVFMPTAGDANTYGAAIVFGGRIAKSSTARGKIVFTVNSFLDVVNMQVPTNTIENTDATSGYSGATPLPGQQAVSQFAVIAGSTPGVLIGDESTPHTHEVYSQGFMIGMFVIFNGGSGTTLAGQLVRIADNQPVTVGATKYNQITLYQPLPWAPTPGTDTFFVGAGYPTQQGSVSGMTLDAAGSGYTAGDILNVTGGGGSGAQVQVVTTGGGGTVTGISIVSTGVKYVATTGAATSGGTGTGATITITTNSADFYGFPYVPAPQQGI